MANGQRMLNGLVLADWSVKDDTLAGIVRGFSQGSRAKSHRFSGNQNAFRVHAMQNVFKAAALLADAVGFLDFKVLEEQFVGIDSLTAHLFDFRNPDAFTVEAGIEK